MTPTPEPSRLTTSRFALGIAIGLSLGFFIGIYLDSFGLGFPIGIIIGVTGVWLFDRVSAERRK